ncbi:collagen-like protein [archaeon]|nr:MAG: collagen-like protein [archaeon]
MQLKQGLHGNLPGEAAATPSPELLAEVARQAGAASAAELKEELKEAGLKLEDIQRGVGHVLQALDKVSDKVDNIGSKLDESANAAKKRDEELLRMMKETQVRTIQQDRSQLIDVMRALGRNSVKLEKFSDAKQVEYMSRHAQYVAKAGDFNVITIHPDGISTETPFKSLDGPDGSDGPCGPAGRDGFPGQPGQNGQEGTHGGDGEIADDGGEGSNAHSFEVWVTLEAVNSDGSYSYAIEHSATKQSTVVTLVPGRDILLFTAAGGKGGDG